MKQQCNETFIQTVKSVHVTIHTQTLADTFKMRSAVRRSCDKEEGGEEMVIVLRLVCQD